MARTGRRRGGHDTREEILAAARAAFAERGYDAASIRVIAAEAGVDPALVHHYFGTKDNLFLEAMRVPFDPVELAGRAVAGGIDGAGERLVRTLLSVWDSSAGGAAAALVRSAMSNELIGRMLRKTIFTRLMRRLTKELNLAPTEASLRVNLVATQITGLIVMRYIIKIEPLASMPPEAIVRLIAPTVQRYLADPLPQLPSRTSPAALGR